MSTEAKSNKPSAEEMRSTVDKIDVMAAYVRGERIQAASKGRDDWLDMIHSSSWDWGSWDFRVKPEGPRTWFIAVLPGAPVAGVAVGYAYATREEAELRGGIQCEIVEVVEKVVGGEK